MLPYDPTRASLLRPDTQPTVFTANKKYTPTQVGIECARLAYIRHETSPGEFTRLRESLALIGLEDVATFDDQTTDTHAFAAKGKGLAVVGFRGTQSDHPTDIATDLEAVSVDWDEGGRVHHGFAKAFGAVEAPIVAWLGQLSNSCPTLVCGHSLGAALATLLASVAKPPTLVTIGCPRVGDAAFVATLEGVGMTRIVNCCDVVTRVPPETVWYTHAGDETYVDRRGVLLERPDAQTMHDDQTAARLGYLAEFAWKFGTAPVRDLADHAPINYVRAFF